MLYEWGMQTWPEFVRLRESVQVAVMPIGAVEEHGPHLPLDTDNIAASRLAAQICERTSTFLLPTMPYGQVWSLRRFPGSLSISNRTLKSIVSDLAISLKTQGMKGLVIVSGHLGNMQALKEAAREILESVGFPIMYLFYPGLNQAAAGKMTAPVSHPSIVHADELETSILLSLKPEVVKMDLAVSEYPEYPDDFDHSPVFWDEVNTSGVFGDATKATKQKGDVILAEVLENAVRLVEAFKEKV